MAFHNRVGSRLAAWLETTPSRPFKDVELSTIIRYYDLYQNLRNHPVSQFIRRHRLHKAASWGWAVFNYNSPFYWGRRAAYEVGRRLLLARLADLVGEEAMLLYGRRGKAGRGWVIPHRDMAATLPRFLRTIRSRRVTKNADSWPPIIAS